MGWDGTWGNHMEKCATLGPWQAFRRILIFMKFQSFFPKKRIIKMFNFYNKVFTNVG
jgi:hypothetical protein